MKYTHYIVAVAAIGAITASPVAAKETIRFDTDDDIKAMVTTSDTMPIRPRLEKRGEARDGMKAEMKANLDDKRGMAHEVGMNLVNATVKRITATADVMTTFGTKLEARINAAKANGVDVTAWSAIYTDYTAKVADAKVQAKAAADIAATAKVDGTTKELVEANKKIAMDARAKIKLARASLQAARADADKLVKAFRTQAKSEVKVDASASVKAQ